MTDQQKARNEALDDLRRRAFNTAFLMQNDLDFEEEMTNRIVDAVLSADPHVIAEAMGGEYETECRILEDGEDELCPVIVLPPRKVEL